MAWIELHQSLVEHKKMDDLLRESGLSRDTALGRLCILWLWTLSNREDGLLTGVDARRLGQILDLQPRKAQSFLDALVRSGFLDQSAEGLRVHDWEDYTGRLLEIRRKNADRVRRNRERQRSPSPEQDENDDCDGNANSNANGNANSNANSNANGNGHVTPLPNQTKPNLTKPDQTKPGFSFFDPVDHPDLGAGAGNEKLTDYLLDRGLLPEEWLGATRELLDRSRLLTDGLFKVFCTRQPGYTDYAKVFPLVTRYRETERDRVWDEDREDLLGYAFEQAALSGAGGSWPYIDGVLGRMRQRGIRTRRQAEDYEERWLSGEIVKVT